MVFGRLELPHKLLHSDSANDSGKDTAIRHRGTEPRGTRPPETYNRGQRKHGLDWKAQIVTVKGKKTEEENS